MTDGMQGNSESWIERLPLAQSRPGVATAATLALLALAFFARSLMPLAPGSMVFVTFFPAVLLVCFLFGVRYGVPAVLLSAVLGLAFFTRDPMQPGFAADRLPAILPFLILAGLNIAIFHWMQRANAKLRAERLRSAALAETRELLFRELQHRVSNNLGVAAGLLSLQKKRVADPAARTAIEEASRRLGVIGRISRQLYEAEGTTRSVRALLEPLCADVVDAGGKAVRFTVTGGDDMTLAPDAAVPVALIVAEAVANAIEHGFAGREHGTIEVALVRDARAIRIEVRDDGHGLADGFDLAGSGSLGLGIATMLAGQLKGRFELTNGEAGGASARLYVPAG